MKHRLSLAAACINLAYFAFLAVIVGGALLAIVMALRA